MYCYVDLPFGLEICRYEAVESWGYVVVNLGTRTDQDFVKVNAQPKYLKT